MTMKSYYSFTVFTVIEKKKKTNRKLIGNVHILSEGGQFSLETTNAMTLYNDSFRKFYLKKKKEVKRS